MTRFVLYSHDTYGLGHFRRSALLASGLVAVDPENEALILTGSPRAQLFSLPDRIDTVKIPSATKDFDGSYKARKLGGDLEALVALRSGLIAAAVTAYDPDVVLVDHAPTGMAGELRPMFDAIDRLPHRPRLALGLRDIIDDATRVDEAWSRDGVWPALDTYDEILVYGDPRIATTANELDLASRTTAVVTHTGYVAPAMPEPITDEPFLLVTSGGGGDGQALLRRVIEAVEAGATAPMRTLIVSGPLLSASRRAELMVRADQLPSVELIEFSHRMRTLIASAAGIISMAGYNTVVEELAAGTPALLVPRCVPRLEQQLRAERIEPFSNLEHCPIDALTPERIHAFVHTCRGDRPDRGAIELSGVAGVVGQLATIDDSKQVAQHV